MKRDTMQKKTEKLKKTNFSCTCNNTIMAIMTLSILIIHVHNIIIILIASHLIDYTQITPHTIHVTPNILLL